MTSQGSCHSLLQHSEMQEQQRLHMCMLVAITLVGFRRLGWAEDGLVETRLHEFLHYFRRLVGEKLQDEECQNKKAAKDN